MTPAFAPVDAAPETFAFQTDRDVFGHGEFGKQCGLLINCGYSQLFCDARGIVGNFLGADPNLTTVRLNGAGYDLDEC